MSNKIPEAKRLTKFLKDRNMYESFIFYMRNEIWVRQVFKEIKDLVEYVFLNAIAVAFDWDKTPTEEKWYQLNKEWLKEIK